MSKLITNTIRHTGASSDSLTFNSDGHATVENNLTVDGTSTLTGNVTATGTLAASNFSGRNKIRNGAMLVNQRNLTDRTSSGYMLDGWAHNEGTGGTADQVFSSDAPAGFSKSLKIDVTGADASLASGENLHVYQNIEGQDCVDLCFGTAAAKTVTLSFWVMSNKTGTYSIVLENSAANRSYVQDYTISVASTWEKKSITIAGDTSGTWLTTNGIGLRVRFGLASGSTYTTGTVGSWAAADMVGSTNMVNLMDDAANNWWLTGVQLEVGPTSTEFEHKLHGEELARLQRYYYVLVSDNNDAIGVGGWYSGSLFTTHVTFPSTMRSAPTLEKNTGTDMFRVWSSNGYQDGDDVIVERNSTTGCHLDFNSGFSGTQGDAGNISSNHAGTNLSFSAEL